MNVKQPTLRVNTETAMRNQLSSTKLDIKRFQVTPWWSIGYDSVPSLPRAQGQLLVTELQSHRLWGLAKKNYGAPSKSATDYFNYIRIVCGAKGITSSIYPMLESTEVPCFQQRISTLEHIQRVLLRTLKKNYDMVDKLKKSKDVQWFTNTT